MKIMNRPEGFHSGAGCLASNRYHRRVSVTPLPATSQPAPRQFGLRLKINLIVGALTLLFLGVLLVLQLRSIRESVKEETVAANRVAAQLLNRTAWRYAAQGMPALMGFLQGLGRVRSNEIALFDAQGQLLYQSPPSTYKSGRDAPHWFAHLVLPQQSVQAIEFPGGKLEVRSNASRSVLDAWDAFVPLAGLGLGLLVLVNGLVFWVVGRTVRPFGRIVAALDELQAGRFDVALPPLPGTEAAAIGAAFNRMTGVLRQHIDTEKRAARAEEQLLDSRELTRWIDHHIEQERRMIARELHDELGQSVTAIRSLALSVAQRVRALDLQSEQAARLIAEESSRLYDAMHGLIPRLTPLVLDNFGLADALADLVERTRRSHPGLELAHAGRAGHGHPAQRGGTGAVPRRPGGHHQRAAAWPGQRDPAHRAHRAPGLQPGQPGQAAPAGQRGGPRRLAAPQRRRPGSPWPALAG